MGPTRAKTSHREEGKRRYSVLIVDDEPDTLESLRELFEGEADADVHVAKNGADALAVLDLAPIDLMIVDYRMVGMNGLELLAHVQERAPGIDRVMLTAYADLQVAVAAINEGRVKRFFTKPIEPDRFLEVVHELKADRAARTARKRAFAKGLDAMRRESH